MKILKLFFRTGFFLSCHTKSEITFKHFLYQESLSYPSPTINSDKL